jgi:hypothetical protein
MANMHPYAYGGLTKFLVPDMAKMSSPELVRERRMGKRYDEFVVYLSGIVLLF